ncbi:MAG: PLP-dependent aminotransferase family protein [Bacteroidetes bacterium]|nr:PLP-dependent aminotransferase family protein [Bacteroidota bacterium]
MIILNLDKNSDTPLFKQVIVQLKNKIDADVLKPGEKLPSTRTLSNMHGVNRTTIYKAYQELWALGYIESRSGSYSYVRQRRELKSSKEEQLSNTINWANKINPDAEKVYQMFGKINYPFSEEREDFEGIDFGRLHPDTRIFPVKEFKKSLNKVISEKGEIVFDYGKSKGFDPLREFIARRSRMHGISVGVQEILITNGAQNAIDLLMKLLAKPGSRVFVESPTYGMIIPTLKYYNCEIVSIPMLPDGVDIKAIEKEFQNGLPAFFYTMPNFHNPTGITTNQEHREKLIALFEKYHVPIIEDAYEEEMKYFGKVPLSIKTMDINQIVFYVGSFSKILFPGIRVGWIAADKNCIERLTTLKRFADLSSSLPEQAALADFCMQGHYELHIKRIHKIYRKRMQLAVQQLQKKIKNKNIKWIEPNGGFTIWLMLENVKIDYDDMNKIFYKNKIRTALGKDFYPNPEKKKYCRLSIASLDENEIVEGIERLAKSFKEIYKS